MVDASQPKKPAPVDTSNWLSRNQATDLLGCSGQTLINYENRGTLNPQRVRRPDSLGVVRDIVVYDPNELSKLPHQRKQPVLPRDPGDIAARSFELFDGGKSVREIVVELRELPEKIHALHEAWLDAGGSDVVITLVAKEALEKIVGRPFGNVADLVDALTSSREELTKLVGPFTSFVDLADVITKRLKDRVPADDGTL